MYGSNFSTPLNRLPLRMTHKQSLLAPTVGWGRGGVNPLHTPMLIKHPYRLPLKFNPVPGLKCDIYKLFIRKTTNNSWKNTVFAYFWFKNQKIQNCFWFILNNFLRAFQRRFQNSKIFTASGDIQQNPRKRQKIHEKIQFFVFFFIKNPKIQKCSDLA